MNPDQTMWSSRHSSESLFGYCAAALTSVSGASTTTTSDDACASAKVSKQASSLDGCAIIVHFEQLRGL